MNPSIIEFQSSCALPTQWATFELHAFKEQSTGKEHLAITLGHWDEHEPVLARIHSECMTGDTLFSLRCDCGPQLKSAFEKIAKEGRGIVLYLRQEGRGIGLVNKIKAYQLQENGADTVQANRILGFEDDQRSYDICKGMLEHFNVRALRLLTNNPEKLIAIEQLGFEVSRSEHLVGMNPFNANYLETKEIKMGHLFTPTPDIQSKV
jgi:GTP cyclohydrolase II